MILDGFRIESRETPEIEQPRYATAPGRNNDGIDLIDCARVRLSNCAIKGIMGTATISKPTSGGGELCPHFIRPALCRHLRRLSAAD